MKLGAAHHPYILERIDGLLLGTYRRQGVVIDLLHEMVRGCPAPSSLLGPDYGDMDTTVFYEVSDLFTAETEAQKKRIAAMVSRR